MGDATFPTDGSWAADLGGVHVEFAAGGLDRLGETVRSLPGTPIDAGTRVLVVTDSGLVEAGHAERALVSLRAAGLEPAVFDGARENPTTEDVDRGVEAARAHGTELLVALGGGSAMDCCKGINFLITQGGEMEDYWGVDKATQPMLPSLGVPTTGGTGSEAQRFALISRASDHRKMACGDRKARFRTVILDPDLLATVPHSVAAVTGLDAVSHAVEAFVTRRRNPVSKVFALESWRRLERSLERYLDDPSNADARANSGADGRFRFLDVPPGTYTMSIRAKDHSPLTTEPFEVTEGTQVDRGVVALEMGASLEGRVINIPPNSDGEQPAYTMIRLQNVDGETLHYGSVSRSGKYRFGDLTPGTYRVVVSLPGGEDRTSDAISVNAGAPTNFDFVL